MARNDGDGPSDRAWRAAVVLGLALVAGAFALALAYPMVRGPCPCRDPDGRLALVAASSRDLWVAVEAARYVANGALGFVYESSPALTALPLSPILLAPLVAAGDALGLSGPPAPAATLYLLLVPFTVGLAVPLLHQVRGLLRDAGDRASALPVQLWTALLVVVPVLVVYGHGEDALALPAVLAAVRLTARGRWAAAGLVLGVAIASKQWALLALPVLLARSAPAERARLAAASLALPAALALLVLSVDWPHASRALLHPPNYPGFGHAAPWVEAGWRPLPRRRPGWACSPWPWCSPAGPGPGRPGRGCWPCSGSRCSPAARSSRSCTSTTWRRACACCWCTSRRPAAGARARRSRAACWSPGSRSIPPRSCGGRWRRWVASPSPTVPGPRSSGGALG